MKNYFTIHFRLFCKLLLFLALPFTTTAQLDYYWVGGTGDWSDYANHWATSSGGTTFHTSVPSDVDNVYFDENSFTAEGQVVTVNDYYEFVNMDWTGAKFSPAVEVGNTGYGELNSQGSVVFIESMTFSLPYFSMFPETSSSVRFNGLALNETSFAINLESAAFELLDSISVEEFSIIGVFSEFNSNGHPIHVVDRFGFTTNVHELMDFSNSTIYAKRIDTKFNVINNGSTAFGRLITDNTNIEIIYPDGNSQISVANSFSENYTIKANHQIIIDDPLFNNLIIDPGVELIIDDAITGIEFENLVAKGTVDSRITIKSDNPGTAAKLIKNTGEVNLEWVVLEDIAGTGGATYNAYAAIDNGNVTGINFDKLDQTISFDVAGRTFKDIERVFPLNGITSSGLSITYSCSNPSVAEITSTNELLVKGMGIAQITASQAGDGLVNPADPVIRVLEVTKANQTLTLEDIPDTWIGDGYANVVASIDSGLPITYLVNGPATLDGGVLEINDVGTVQVRVSQPGNENYLPADDVIVSFEVFKKGQTITFAEIENTWIGEEFVNLNTSVSSGLMLDYQVSGPATLNGNVLEFTGAGNVQVTASQSGNENYLPADDVIVSFEVFKKGQTITFAEIPDTSEDDGFVNLDAVSDSGLPITYSVVGPGRVVDGALEFTGNGMVQVTAKQDGNDLYLAAEDIRRSFEILASETEKPLFLTQPEGLGLVYPNPVADYLYFDPQVSIESIIVRDLMGKTFYEGGLEQDYLDMSQYESGVYMLTVKQTDGEEIIKRIKVN